MRRFIQEAKTASSLNHPNIITIHEIDQAEGAHFIATEYIDGQTLRQLIALARMTLPAILDVSMQVASALQAAHAADIIHRDIKPDNIMLRPDGVVKVLDFGLAKLTENSRQSILTPNESEADTMIKVQTAQGMVLGTISYMSPEQARAQILDQRTDVFSFGVVLYEMVSGHLPFTGASNIDRLVSILEKEPVSLDEYAPNVPAEFQRIISKALRKDREERYQTIKDLLIDLKRFKEDLSFAQRVERSRPPQSRAEPQTATHPSPEAILTDQQAVVATNEALPYKAERRNGRTLAVVLGIIVLGISSTGGVILWRRGTPPTVISNPAPLGQRSISYWITVQKYRDGKPYQEPFRLRDDINFEKDYRIRLGINSPQSGRLYLLNEGPAGADKTPTFNVMFPSTSTNNNSASLAANQQIQIPEQSWFSFDEQQGTEKIWVVWAEKEIAELEAVKGFANPEDRGVISSPGLRTAVNEFLKAHSSSSPSIERNQEKKETVVRVNDEILVHVIKLEHN